MVHLKKKPDLVPIRNRVRRERLYSNEKGKLIFHELTISDDFDNILSEAY